MRHNIADQLFSNAAFVRFGEATAIECDGRTLTYRQLAELCNEAGERLRHHGVRDRDRILIRARDAEGQVAAILGAMRTNLVPVILSSRATDNDLKYVAGETGATALVADTEGDGRDIKISEVPSTGSAKASPAVPEEAFWLYSSGTTGRMKGVIHGHRSLASVLSFHKDTLGVEPGIRTFCTSRISFAYAMSNGFLAPLALGATVNLHPEWPTPESTIETIGRTKPDVLFSVPSMYRAWLQMSENKLDQVSDVSRFVSAGEHLPVAVADRWQTLSGGKILDCYGCSETCFLTFASTGKTKPGSVGKPCDGVETELRDETGALVEPGKEGRLFIRHPFLALSYGSNAAADVQARFDDGWFATGDIFRCDEGGNWFYDGREDDWLKVAGQWVSLRAVEDVATKFKGVALASAVAVTDRDGFLRMALFVLPQPEVEPLDITDQLQGFLDQQLPAFKRPKWIRAIDKVPQTSTGKIKKIEFRRMIEESL